MSSEDILGIAILAMAVLFGYLLSKKA
jgi:hypothetical protein